MENPGRSPTAERASRLAEQFRMILGKAKRHLREHGRRHELTPSQVSVVLRLEKEGSATVSDLARAEGMRPQSMGTLVASLQEAKLVRGAPDPSDGRQTLMSLTSTCRKLLKEGRAARQDWLAARIQEKLSARDQETLATALTLLTRLMED